MLTVLWNESFDCRAVVGICRFTISDIRMRLVSNSGDVGVIRLAGFMFEFDVVEAHATAYMELHRVMFSLYACT